MSISFEGYMIRLKATRKGTWWAAVLPHRGPGHLMAVTLNEEESVGEFLTRDAAVDAARQCILEKSFQNLGTSARELDTAAPASGKPPSLGGNGSGAPGIPERRRQRRVPIGRRIPALAHGTLPVSLVDLSLGGARIEHLGQLHPGFPCALEFPAPTGLLRVAAQVVRSSVVGNRRRARGDRHFRYESGLVFAGISPEQETALTNVLGRVCESN